MKLRYLIILLFIATSLFGQFAGGDGSSGSPYQISTAEQLDSVRNYVDEGYYFELINDIDLEEYNLQPIPIGNSYFNGKGYTISNLRYDTSNIVAGNEYYALFGGEALDAVNGYIKNLVIDNYYFENGTSFANNIPVNNVAALVGYTMYNDDFIFKNIEVKNSHIYNWAEGEDNKTGMVFGLIMRGTLDSFYVKKCTLKVYYDENDGDGVALGGFAGDWGRGNNVVGDLSNIIVSESRIELLNTTPYGGQLGGIIGDADNGSEENTFINGFLVNSSVIGKGGMYMGGAIGLAAGSSITYDNIAVIDSEVEFDSGIYLGGFTYPNSGSLFKDSYAFAMTFTVSNYLNDFSVMPPVAEEIYGSVEVNLSSGDGDSKVDFFDSGTKLVADTTYFSNSIIDDFNADTVVGRTEMQDSVMFADLGWDFVDTWEMDDGSKRDGYPKLQNESFMSDYLAYLSIFSPPENSIFREGDTIKVKWEDANLNQGGIFYVNGSAVDSIGVSDTSYSWVADSVGNVVLKVEKDVKEDSVNIYVTSDTSQTLEIDTVYNKEVYVHSSNIEKLYLYYSLDDTSSWDEVGSKEVAESFFQPDTTIFSYNLKDTDYGRLYFKVQKKAAETEIDTTFERLDEGRVTYTKATRSTFWRESSEYDSAYNKIVYRVRTERDPGAGWVNYWTQNPLRYDGKVYGWEDNELKITWAELSRGTEFPPVNAASEKHFVDIMNTDRINNYITLKDWAYYYDPVKGGEWGSIVAKDLRNDKEYIALDLYEIRVISLAWEHNLNPSGLTAGYFMKSEDYVDDDIVFFVDDDGDFTAGKMLEPAPVYSPAMYDIYEVSGEEGNIISRRDYFRGIHPKIWKYGNESGEKE